MSAEIIESLRYMQFDVAPYNSGVIDSAIELIEQQQARIAELEQANNRVILDSSDHVRDATEMVADRQLADAINELRKITAAADAVVERWHTPLWKDAKPTAEYIAALRLAAESARKLLAVGDGAMEMRAIDSQAAPKPATVAVDAGALRDVLFDIIEWFDAGDVEAARECVARARHLLAGGE